MTARLPLVAILVAALAAAGGCGSGELTVYGASSLKQVLPRVEEGPAYSFAGSDALARQIRDGAPADLFAAASPRYPRELARDGLCESPVPFATNTLAVIVPARGSPVRSFGEFERLEGARLAIGEAAVPVGTYSQEVLDRAGSEAVLERNTVSDEQDAAGVVSKVALGSADAGLAYVTDARAAAGRVRAVRIPASAQPTVVYEACMVRRSGARSDQARAYLERLTGPEGQAALKEAGFGPAPAP